MFSVWSTTIVLSLLTLPAASQFSGDDDSLSSGFSPDPLTTGLFAILCIWAFIYGVLSIWNFVCLLIARGHRAPHAFLLPTIVLYGWSNATYMVIIILENIPSLEFFDSLPPLVLPSISFASNLTNNIGTVFLFLAVLAVLWNRQTALHKATEGRHGGHHPALTALHAAFVLLVLIFGIAAPAYVLDTNVRFYTSDQFETFAGRQELDARINTGNNLFYAYASFAVLTFIDVIVTTVVVWRGWKQAGLSDKVTNAMLYGITPLYIVMSLLSMIFVIVFSPHGLPATASISEVESANLASNLLVTGFTITIIIVILCISVKKAWWAEAYAGQAKPGQGYWVGQQAQQAQYTYATPLQAEQAGYYPQQPVQGQTQYAAAPAPEVQPTQYQYEPYAAQPSQHLQSGVGGYAPSSSASPPPHMDASVGGYTPSHSDQAQSVSAGGVVPNEKSGLHVASY